MKKINKNYIILVILMAFILIIALDKLGYIQKRVGSLNVNNSRDFLNTSIDGKSIFWDALKKMNLEVGFEKTKFNENSTDKICFIKVTEKIDEKTKKEIKSWVENGGVIVEITNDSLDEKKFSKEYMGEGIYFKIQDYKLKNYFIMKNSKQLEEFVLELKKLKRPVLFNESIINQEIKYQSFYQDLPVFVKVFIFQSFFCVLGMVLCFGKRFGKAKKYYSEAERSDNEFLIASARLYEKANTIDFIYDAFYKEFQNQFSKTFKTSFDSDWLKIWENFNTRGYKEAKRFYNSKTKSLNSIKDLDFLIQILIKRREKFD